jgi:membrane protein
VPIRRVLPVAILVGIALEIWKYVFLFAWPWLYRKIKSEYGPFDYSASIVIFSLLTALLVLAGAEWSARQPAPPSISA